MIDLIAEEAIYFDGANGENVRREPIPAELADEARRARQHLLEALSMYSDELMELLLAEEAVPLPLIHETVRQAVFSQQLTPVFIGSAYRNKGVQPLLDAVVRYLPSPLDCQIKALAHSDRSEGGALAADPEKPTVAMAFKIVEDPYGTLTFMRIYQGRFVKGAATSTSATGARSGSAASCGCTPTSARRSTRPSAGDIVAVLGVDAASGDTYASQYPYCTLQSMYVPEPVIKMAIAPANRDGADRLSKALQRFRREDPTLHVSVDEETGETIIAGMGELHLEIYLERIRREFKVEVEVGAPKVNYREAPTQAADVQHAAQEADGRGRAVRPHRRPARRAARGRRGAVRLRGRGDRRAGAQAVHSRRGEGLPPVHPQGAGRRLSGRRPEGHARRRLVPRGGQLRHGVPDLRRTAMRENFPKTRPVLLEPVMKIENRVSQPVSGDGGGQSDRPARHGRGHGDGRRDGADRGRSPPGRDLRLFDRPAEHDARAGDVHDGVRPLSPRAAEHRAGSHRAAEGRRHGRGLLRAEGGGRQLLQLFVPSPGTNRRLAAGGAWVSALAKHTSKARPHPNPLPGGRGPCIRELQRYNCKTH